jgi:phage tail sheath protein FI
MPSLSAYRTPGVYVEWLDANAQRLDVGRTDVAGFLGIAERGPLHVATKIESTRQFLTTFGGATAQAYLAYAVEGFFSNGGRTCWVVRVADPDTAAPARIRVSHSGCAPFVLEAASPGRWGDGIHVEAVWGRDRIVALTVTEQDRPAQLIDLDPATGLPIELDRVTGQTKPAASAEKTLLGVLDSELPELTPQRQVNVRNDLSLPLVSLGPQLRKATLSGGADGVAGLRPKHFTGDPTERHFWGVKALERVDGVSFVAAPDLLFKADPFAPDVEFGGFDPLVVRDAQMEILNSCMMRRDRVAILDLPRIDAGAALEYRGGFPATSFGALYHPWIVVSDPLQIRASVRVIPPSGHVAGMFARTDRARGVHKAPANEVLEGVFDLSEILDDAAHAGLNDGSVNAIRSVPGRGVRVLGARTLDPDVRWRYVNIRRLFAMIEEALDEQMQWLTFEPNNPRLWREIDRALRGFLDRLYGAGMLDGATPEDAYFVRCDESTNPPFATDEGRVTCEMGIQPPYPAEFVVVRIGVTRSGIQVEEKGAQDV